MNNSVKPKKIWQYQNFYQEDKFWMKLSKVGMEAIIKPALMLYYTLQSQMTPIGAKAVIMGVLGYLILDVDMIPDFVPVVGLTDDMAALTAAVTKTVSRYIDEDIKKKTEEKINELL